MISFIIFESDFELGELYEKVIKKFLITASDPYEICIFRKYDDEVKKALSDRPGPKVFLMNLDAMEFSATDIARRIRHEGDLESQIILLTKNKKEEVLEDLYAVLYLDLISIDEKTGQYLMRSVRDAYSIVKRNRAFTFTIFDEVYRLPYDEIYFIMKNKRSNTVTIFTKDDTFLYYNSLKKIAKDLTQDPRFFQASRSSILNLNNVLSFDKKSNTVTFKNGMTTDLISRKYRPILENRMKEIFN